MPDEVIMDKSSALLLAMVKCFTYCGTTNRYLSQCYEELFNSAEPPTCYIRLDRSHMVKIITSLKCLKNEDKRKQKLFRRTFGFLLTCDDIMKAKIIIRKMFILLLNKYENDIHVRDAKKDLKEISDLHNMDDGENENENDEDSDCDIECEGLSRSKFYFWVASIKEEVEKNEVNTELNNSQTNGNDLDTSLTDNVYYGPHLAQSFVELLATLPLWSNIMMHHFNSTNSCPTSSGCEAEFKNIKTLLFRNRRGIRIDSFVQTHIQHLNGQLKLALSEQKKYDLKEENDENGSDGYACAYDQLEQENWRAKNMDVKEEAKKFSVKRCKSSILAPIQPTCRVVPILKNGHTIIGRKKQPTIIT